MLRRPCTLVGCLLYKRAAIVTCLSLYLGSGRDTYGLVFWILMGLGWIWIGWLGWRVGCGGGMVGSGLFGCFCYGFVGFLVGCFVFFFYFGFLVPVGLVGRGQWWRGGDCLFGC